MKANSVEEELEHLAMLVKEAEELGIDPWPEKKPPRPWAKFALASFHDHHDAFLGFTLDVPLRRCLRLRPPSISRSEANWQGYSPLV